MPKTQPVILSGLTRALAEAARVNYQNAHPDWEAMSIKLEWEGGFCFQYRDEAGSTIWLDSDYVPEKDIGELVAGELHAALRDAVLEEVKAARNVWEKMSEFDQEALIIRVDQRMRWLIEKVVGMLIGHDFPVVKAKLEQLTAKDGLKATVMISSSDKARYDVLDAVGSTIYMVIGDVREFEKERGRFTSQPDQPELPGMDVAQSEDTVGFDTFIGKTREECEGLRDETEAHHGSRPIVLRWVDHEVVQDWDADAGEWKDREPGGPANEGEVGEDAGETGSATAS